MSEKLYKETEKVADSQGLSISAFVRHLITKNVSKKKKEEKEKD